MRKQPIVFTAAPKLDGVYIARATKLQSIAIRLTDDGLCVYSPLRGIGEEDAENLTGIGRVAFLLAPNHYHHRGLSGHIDWFPEAKLVCSNRARPRLEQQTGYNFAPLDALAERLPTHIQILQPDGLKTGETWLEIADPQTPSWIICDAFCSNATTKDDIAKTPSMLGTFPKYGVSDAGAYKAWVKKQLACSAPKQLIPCHGPPIRGRGSLAAAIKRLLDAEL